MYVVDFTVTVVFLMVVIMGSLFCVSLVKSFVPQGDDEGVTHVARGGSVNTTRRRNPCLTRCLKEIVWDGTLNI